MTRRQKDTIIAFVLAAAVILALTPNVFGTEDVKQVNYKADAPESAAAEPSLDKKATIRTATGHTYRVKKGDNLTRIAKLFNVSPDELLASNPAIKNKNLIRIGQKLTIPRLYRLDQKPANEVGDTDFVFVAKKELTDIQARLKELAAEDSKENNYDYFLFIAIFILGTSLGISSILLSIIKSKTNALNKPTKEEVIKTIRALNGLQISEILDEVLTEDEHGNRVALKNAKDFLANDKRSYLRNLPADHWQEAIAEKNKR